MPKSRARNPKEPSRWNPALEIDDMVESDLGQVLSIECSCFSTPWTRENFRFEIHNPCSRNLVVRRGSRILAYVSVWMVTGGLKINNLAVETGWRRRGLGAALLKRVMDTARSEGCEKATLEVRPSNTAAGCLYREHGFRPVGRQKSYYQDTREDAILMMVDLGSRRDKE